VNYTELTTAIKDYCQNSETTFVNHLNDFIKAAEDKVFLAIQMPSFWKSDVDQDCVVNQAEYALDDGTIDIFSVRISEASTPTQATGVEYGPVRYLLRKDYDFLLEAYPGTASAANTGVPKYYSVSSASVGTNNPRLTIRFGPIPDAVYPFTVDYYGKVAADSIVTAEETWLSVSFPDVLLYGSLVEAYTFMKGEQDMIQAYERMFGEKIAMLKNMGEARQSDDVFVDGAKQAPSL
jgi:hypothetical protein